jgi:hypothetical protein
MRSALCKWNDGWKTTTGGYPQPLERSRKHFSTGGLIMLKERRNLAGALHAKLLIDIAGAM